MDSLVSAMGTPGALRPAPVWRSAWTLWLGYAAVLVAAPLLFGSSLAHTLLTQMGIAIIACLAYNILLGQGGMLSFGHAVYSGLGAFFAIHALNLVGDGRLHLPVSLVPLVGGLAGLLCAAVLGYVTTRRSGTTFAMITLGIGELVASMAPMVPEFFGGEGGVTSNRVVGSPVLGISFGPQIQVYYLVALYCFVCTALMFAFTRTPLGRMLNAVRDNAERVEFVGYDAQRVRYLAFVVSGLFAGVAGGLTALNFELVSAELVGTPRSGAYLLFVVLGGTGAFYGPIIGAVLMVLAMVLLSELTRAWLLYLGLAFMLMVMFAPGGIASLIEANLRAGARGGWRVLLRLHAALAAGAAPMLLGAVALVEMVYHRQLDDGAAPAFRFAGVLLDPQAPLDWAAAAATMLAGAVAFELARRYAASRWPASKEMAA